MIERLLPPRVRTAEIFGNGLDGARQGLFPEEADVVARAVPKRQREFADVRACARAALGRLGVPPVPLVPGHRGAPAWPEGVIGSMTHCDGYRAAAVALGGSAAVGDGSADGAIGVGIDAEPGLPLPDGVLDVVSLPAEREQLRALAAAHGEVCWDRLLFSAKESVFKVWYPLTGRELDFSQAEIAIDATAGTFSARLLVEGPVLPGGERLREMTGRWEAGQGLLVTALFLGARPAQESDGGAATAGEASGAREAGPATSR